MAEASCRRSANSPITGSADSTRTTTAPVPQPCPPFANARNAQSAQAEALSLDGDSPSAVAPLSCPPSPFGVFSRLAPCRGEQRTALFPTVARRRRHRSWEPSGPLDLRFWPPQPLLLGLGQFVPAQDVGALLSEGGPGHVAERGGVPGPRVRVPRRHALAGPAITKGLFGERIIAEQANFFGKNPTAASRASAGVRGRRYVPAPRAAGGRWRTAWRGRGIRRAGHGRRGARRRGRLGEGNQGSRDGD